MFRENIKHCITFGFGKNPYLLDYCVAFYDFEGLIFDQCTKSLLPSKVISMVVWAKKFIRNFRFGFPSKVPLGDRAAVRSLYRLRQSLGHHPLLTAGQLQRFARSSLGRTHSGSIGFQSTIPIRIVILTACKLLFRSLETNTSGERPFAP